MIFAYLLVFAYAFALIFGIGPIIKRLFSGEISRKVVHIMLFGIWILISYRMRDSIHQVIVPVIFTALNTISYKYKLYGAIERENNNHPGTIYFAIVVTIVMILSFFKHEYYLCGGIAICCMTFGDGFAALIGANVHSKKIATNKSVAGTAACFFSTAIALYLFFNRTLLLSDIIIIALLTSILELVGNGLDNFSITLSITLVSYLLLHVNPVWTRISCMLAILIFIVVFFSKAISYYGSLVSMAIVFVFSFSGHVYGIILLLGSYFTIFFIAILKSKTNRIQRNEKHFERGAVQIIINGLCGTIFMLLFMVASNNKFLLCATVAIGGCFVDSISSDVGVLSPKQPVDILNHKVIQPGLSGGVTLLGTASAIIVTFIVTSFSYIFLRIRLIEAITIFILIMSQTLLDSILGSCLQVKYKCKVCGKITEKKKHCNFDTNYYMGCKFINNNAINAITSIFVSAFAAMVL